METLRYSRLGKEDLVTEPRNATFEVRLADGRRVTLHAVDIAYFLADAYAEASLPSPGQTGRLARVTDAEQGLWLDMGTEWVPVTGFGIPDSTKAALPTAGVAGRLRRLTDDDRSLWLDTGSTWASLTGRVFNVEHFGAKGDATTDDTAAIQAAIDAAADAGTTNVGAVVYVPPGRYVISEPLVLPRTGSTPTNIVHLVGANPRSSALVGSSAFPTNRAMIEWEAVAAPCWHQRIARLDFVLPNVDGTKAIWYAPTSSASEAAIRAEVLQIDLEDLLLEGSNGFHARLIHLQGNLKLCTLRRLYGDPNLSTETYDTVLLEVDSTFAEDDASGLHYSLIEHLVGGVRRGGRCAPFKGRQHNSTFRQSIAGIGMRNDPTYHFVNCRGGLIASLSNEGASEKPQVKVEGCQQVRFENVNVGSPSDVGTGVGNGIEFVGSTDCVWDGQFRRVGNPSFTASSVKHLTLDATSTRNRFTNFLLAGPASTEVEDNGADNYGEFYDVNNDRWHTIGAFHTGIPG